MNEQIDVLVRCVHELEDGKLKDLCYCEISVPRETLRQPLLRDEVTRIVIENLHSDYLLWFHRFNPQVVYCGPVRKSVGLAQFELVTQGSCHYYPKPFIEKTNEDTPSWCMTIGNAEFSCMNNGFIMRPLCSPLEAIEWDEDLIGILDTTVGHIHLLNDRDKTVDILEKYLEFFYQLKFYKLESQRSLWNLFYMLENEVMLWSYMNELPLDFRVYATDTSIGKRLADQIRTTRPLIAILTYGNDIVAWAAADGPYERIQMSGISIPTGLR